MINKVAENKDSFDRELGFKLKTIRQMHRMTQQRLGELLGITFQQVQKYENGLNRIAPEKINLCAQIFDVPVGYFFGRSDENHIHFNRKVMTIATAIASLPGEDLAKRVYQLVQSINDNLTDQKKRGYTASINQLSLKSD